ncbi:MAG: ribonuclease HI [Anaerolineae bacterium]|nr:ribonuclease HI [Anaerolineae bacterium]
MSKKKKQYYIVINGRNPGIYNTWFGDDGAADQVLDYEDAIYKGFYTQEEAIAWLNDFPTETLAINAPNVLEWLKESRQYQPQRETIGDSLNAGKVVIFTDGGAISNPGPGGYGVLLRYKGHRKELSGGFRSTTNNRMELMACIAGLSALKHKCQVILCSDSKYVVNNMQEGHARRWQANGWKREKNKKAENVDLWEQLLDLDTQHDIEFKWVRGHVGNRDNERCDQLATEAATKPDLPADTAFESGQTQWASKTLFS